MDAISPFIVSLEKKYAIQIKNVQVKALAAMAMGTDVVALWRTGGGKSLPPLLFAKLKKGLVVSIVPLKAIMQSQALECAGYDVDCTTLLGGDDVRDAIACIQLREAHVLYTTPEKILAGSLKHIQNAHPVLWVVDEGHQVARCGDNFRLVYTMLGAIRASNANTPIYVATATATPDDLRVISERLELRTPIVLKTALHRDGLALHFKQVCGYLHPHNIQQAVWAEVLKHLEPGRKWLLHCGSKADCEGYAANLNRRDIRARAFHSSTPQKSDVLSEFRAGRIDVIVCTTTLEMGYHMPDIAGCVLLCVPSCIHTLVQFAGRIRGAGTITVFLPANTFAGFVTRHRQMRADEDQKQLRQDMLAVHRLVRAPLCKWSVIAEYFNEGMIDPCGNCCSCDAHRVGNHPTVDLSDLLNSLYDAMLSIEDYRIEQRQADKGAKWNTYEVQMCQLLSLKQKRQVRDKFPPYVCHVLWDLGGQYPQFGEHGWKDVLWHATTSGVLVPTAEESLSDTTASITYLPGQRLTGSYAVLTGLSLPPPMSTSQVTDTQHTTNKPLPCPLHLEDLECVTGTKRFDSVRANMVNSEHYAFLNPTWRLRHVRGMVLEGDVIDTAASASCHPVVTTNSTGRILHMVGTCGKIHRCEHALALALHMRHLCAVDINGQAASQEVATKEARGKQGEPGNRAPRTGKPQSMALVRTLMSEAEDGRHCIKALSPYRRLKERCCAVCIAACVIFCFV